MSMDVSDVMDALGVRLATIAGLRVFDFPPDSGSAPLGIVMYPDGVEYDETMVRGADRALFPVHVVVGRVSDRASRDQLSEYMAGSGSKSVKAAVEGDKTLGGAAQSVRVMRATVAVFTLSGVEHIGARFEIDVVA